MIDPRKYSIKVQLVEDGADSYYEASVEELPGVAAFEPSYEEAYTAVISAISALQEAAEEDSRPFPVPIRHDDEYSGRVTLRMPRSLHKTLEARSKQESVSLNQHIVYILTAGSSLDDAKDVLQRELQHWLGGISRITNEKFPKPSSTSPIFEYLFNDPANVGMRVTALRGLPLANVEERSMSGAEWYESSALKKGYHGSTSGALSIVKDKRSWRQ